VLDLILADRLDPATYDEGSLGQVRADRSDLSHFGGHVDPAGPALKSPNHGRDGELVQFGQVLPLAQRNAVPQPGPDAQQVEQGQAHPFALAGELPAFLRSIYAAAAAAGGDEADGRRGEPTR